MSDPGAFTDWLSSDNWQDYRQQRAIRALGSEVESLNSSLVTQAREASRLRSRLSHLEGSLEERMRRLTRAFDAFVELSDLRMTLSMFDPPALARHRARQVIAALSVTGPEPAFPERPEVDDVPGYWLPPALAALVALVRDDAAEPHLEAALARDPQRTALLITLGAAVGGRTDISSQWLDRAMPPLSFDGTATRAQRMLWTEALAGRFGPSGAELMLRRLAEFVDGLAPQQRDEIARQWAERVRALPGGLGRAGSSLSLEPAVASALGAGSQIDQLRTLVDSGTEPSASSPSSVAGGGELEKVLRSLVDEGSDEEQPLLHRAAELRAVIEDRAAPAAEPWDAPAGTAAQLLLEDAFRADATPSGPAARRAGAAWLLAAAEPLATRAATDPPATATIEIAGVDITVDPDGATGTLDPLHAAIDAHYVPDAARERTTKILIGVGVLLVALVVLWPRWYAVLGAIAGAGVLFGAAVRWRNDRRLRADGEVQRASERASADRRIAATATDLADLQATLARTGQEAAGHLDAIKARLGGRAGAALPGGTDALSGPLPG